MLVEIACYYFGSLFFFKLDIGSDIWTCLFLVLNAWVVWCMSWLWSMYAWMLIVCVDYFSGDRIERRLCGGRGGIWVPRRRRSGTSQPRQAIYLLHIWILLSNYALFITIFFLCIVFYVAIVPYIAIVDDLAPQVDLISSIKMTPLTPNQHPCIRDLMISIKVFGQLVVEPKKL
jgi:hypothetical protein